MALLIVLLVGLGIFTYFAFFSANPPWGKPSSGTTPSGTSTDNPITEGPLPQVKTMDAAGGKVTMQLTWTTSGSYKGQVNYGTDTKYGSTSQLETEAIKSHVATLPDLKLGTSYHYQIVLKNQDNKEWTSSDFTGKTPDPPPSQ